MTQAKKTSKFGIGLLIGTVVGGIAALFLSPNSGEENREIVAQKAKELKRMLEEHELENRIKQIFGEVTDDAKAVYLKAKEELIDRLSRLKEAVNEINKDKYLKVVDDVVNNIKKEYGRETNQLDKLKEQLVADWQKIVKSQT